MFSEALIIQRIAEVEKQLTRAAASAVAPPPPAVPATVVPVLPYSDFELDEQRRIASEEWHLIQEDRYRLFQQTVDPVWSVDVRFAGHSAADSAVNDNPASLLALGQPSAKHRPQPRSAAAALLDANEAIKLISSIDASTATRFGGDFASLFFLSSSSPDHPAFVLPTSPCQACGRNRGRLEHGRQRTC
jgi:hypothetical protein